MSAEQIKTLLTEKLDMYNPWELLMIMTVSLGYFGLLRKTEILTIENRDVHINKKTDEIEIFFTTVVKRDQLASNSTSRHGYFIHFKCITPKSATETQNPDSSKTRL